MCRLGGPCSIARELPNIPCKIEGELQLLSKEQTLQSRLIDHQREDGLFHRALFADEETEAQES